MSSKADLIVGAALLCGCPRMSSLGKEDRPGGVLPLQFYANEQRTFKNDNCRRRLFRWAVRRGRDSDKSKDR